MLMLARAMLRAPAGAARRVHFCAATLLMLSVIAATRYDYARAAYERERDFAADTRWRLILMPAPLLRRFSRCRFLRLYAIMLFMLFDAFRHTLPMLPCHFAIRCRCRDICRRRHAAITSFSLPPLR